MDLLQAEINRKRKLNENIRTQFTSSNNSIGSSKFIRVADRNRMAEEERMAEQRKLDESREQRVTLKIVEDKRPVEAVLLSAEKKVKKYNHLKILSINEVKDKLRSFGLPITYFGETSDERLERLVTAMRSKDMEDDAINEVDEEMKHKVTAHDDEEAALEAEDLLEELAEQRKTGDKNADGESGDDDASDAEDKGTSSSSGKSLQAWDHKVHFSAMPNLSPEKIVYKFFRALIKQWEIDLNLRDVREKSTAKGKEETRIQKQCKDGIRPLFKLCKRKEVPEDILIKLQSIVKHCEDGNFRLANDDYISTAIGNSAWPMGVTMVGIHERSGRERISTSKVAHMMNNELQRKYFTSVKRLMTYAQNKRTDVAPSMKVLG